MAAYSLVSLILAVPSKLVGNHFCAASIFIGRVIDDVCTTIGQRDVHHIRTGSPSGYLQSLFSISERCCKVSLVDKICPLDDHVVAQERNRNAINSCSAMTTD